MPIQKLSIKRYCISIPFIEFPDNGYFSNDYEWKVMEGYDPWEVEKRGQELELKVD